MKAVVVHAANDLRVDEIPDPVIGPDEVLVAMEYGGICGSDLAYWRHGASGTAILKEPLVLGHEVAGRIVALGKEVDTNKYQVGAAVTVHPATLVGDGKMPEVLAGRENLYPVVRYYGSAAFTPHEQGGFSNFRAVRAEAIRLLPDNVSTRQAAVAEPLGVAIHAVNRAGEVKGQRVLVNGSGPIGALVAAVAKFRGAAEVSVADISPEPLQIAAQMGADRLINRSIPEDLPEDVDIVFEASGVPACLADLLLATRRGGRIVQVGNLPADARPVALGQLVTREIEYIGSYRFVDEITEAVEAIANGLDIDPIITHEFPIEEAAQAFATAADRSSGSSKVVLKLN